MEQKGQWFVVQTLSGHEMKVKTNIEKRLTLEEMEERMIREAIRRLDGNLSRVSRELGITRRSLYRRLEKYGIGS